MDNLIISVSAASKNPYLSTDGFLDLARLQKLNDRISKEVAKAETEPKPIATYVVGVKAKIEKYSAAKAKKNDLTYRSRRAFKIGERKRKVNLATSKPILAVYNVREIENKTIKEEMKKGLSAVKSHIRKLEAEHKRIKKEKEKVRDAKNIEFDKAISELSGVLQNAGIKENNIVVGAGMFGKNMMVQLPNKQVVAVSLADMKRFRAAKKAAKES